jgi:hypothetical protein
MTADASHYRRVFAHSELWAQIGRRMLQGALLGNSDAMLLAGMALALGLFADLLFNGAALGINVAVWHASLIASVGFCAPRLGRPLERNRWLLLILSLLFSSLLALRASPVLQAFDLAGASGLLALGLLLPLRKTLLRLDALTMLLSLVAAAASLALGAYRLLAGLRWDAIGAARLRDDAVAVAQAMVVAVPLFVVFGGLFLAADAVFESQVRSLAVVDLSTFQSHVLYMAGGFAGAAAALWSATRVEVPDDLDGELPDERRLLPVQTAVLLAPLVGLFGVFVLVQLQVLFGGERAVLQSLDLTYSQYARRGFFELVAASALLLPLLLAVNWARRRDGASTRLFYFGALSLVALLTVVMASAWQRLDIYIDALGLTELRFYAAVVLVWLMLAFAWFSISVLGPVRNVFLSGIGFSATVVLLSVNLMNPDAFIVRTNTDRLDEGREFDAAYVSALSADAVPTAIARLDRLPTRDRCVIVEVLSHWVDIRDGLREFNLGRYWAERLVRERLPGIEAGCL